MCYFGAIGLVACVDLEGELIWEQELGMFEMNADFGTGSALAIGGGNVFIQNDNNESSFVVAFSMEDGKQAWRVERPKGTAWASPTMWTHGDATDLVVCGPDSVTGYAPDSGDVRWRVEGIGGTFSASALVTTLRAMEKSIGPGSTTSAAGRLPPSPARARGSFSNC